MEESNKPSWDEYFIDMTYLVAQRSIDPSTKCGCVIVSDDHAVLSIGYNSPPRDCMDDKIPLSRPEKYDYFVHAEENALLNAARNGIALEGATAYVTGTPCCRCFRGLLGAGIKKVIHGPNAAKMHTSQHDEVKELMNISGKTGLPKMEIIEFEGRIGHVLFEITKEYMQEKFGTCIIESNENITINHKES
jgi:dCMP deaminase